MMIKNMNWIFLTLLCMQYSMMFSMTRRMNISKNPMQQTGKGLVQDLPFSFPQRYNKTFSNQLGSLSSANYYDRYIRPNESLMSNSQFSQFFNQNSSLLENKFKEFDTSVPTSDVSEVPSSWEIKNKELVFQKIKKSLEQDTLEKFRNTIKDISKGNPNVTDDEINDFVKEILPIYLQNIGNLEDAIKKRLEKIGTKSEPSLVEKMSQITWKKFMKKLWNLPKDSYLEVVKALKSMGAKQIVDFIIMAAQYNMYRVLSLAGIGFFAHKQSTEASSKDGRLVDDLEEDDASSSELRSLDTSVSAEKTLKGTSLTSKDMQLNLKDTKKDELHRMENQAQQEIKVRKNAGESEMHFGF